MILSVLLSQQVGSLFETILFGRFFNVDTNIFLNHIVIIIVKIFKWLLFETMGARRSISLASLVLFNELLLNFFILGDEATHLTRVILITVVIFVAVLGSVSIVHSLILLVGLSLVFVWSLTWYGVLVGKTSVIHFTFLLPLFFILDSWLRATRLLLCGRHTII